MHCGHLKRLLKTLSPQNLVLARDRIFPHIRKTPLENSIFLSNKFQLPVYLKLENWQKTGSFKIRGALNRLLSLSEDEKKKGVITASAGNHALGVAHAAKSLAITAKIVVPENASPAKVKALQNYDLKLLKKGVDYDESEEVASEIQKREGLTFIHAFDDPEIIAGQGTIGLEILAELPDAGTIVVPIGGGGLISGVALAAKSVNPKVRIIGVQSEASPAMFDAVRAGKVVESAIDETIADGLAGRFVSELTLDFVQRHVDDVVLVSEDSIKETLKLLFESEHMTIEGSAAVGLAALLSGKVSCHGKTVFVLTGRNIDSSLFKSII